MPTKFIISGSEVYPIRMNSDTALDKLPPKIYTVRFAQQQGFYLETTKDKLALPSKIYGKSPERVDKCIKSYKDRTASTGILLTGDKGTGKTLLMSLLANEVMESLDLPVLLIKDPYHGAGFTTFIETIGECCLVFDEFGKMYTSLSGHSRQENDVPQKSLLSLMDGVDKTKRLLIFTENSEIDISEFMLNRPSRVYYHFRYKKLDEDSIVDYCVDHNVNSVITKDIIDLSRHSKIFSFDMLQSIVEEHLRFNSSIDDITVELNIDIRESFGTMIEVTKITENGSNEERAISGSPFISKPGPRDYAYIRLKNGRLDPKSIDAPVPAAGTRGSLTEDDDDYDEFNFQDSDLAFESKGQLVYKTTRYTIVAKDVPASFTNYSLLL